MKNTNAIADEYIGVAEEEFGPICSDWEYVGVEINNKGPHLRYYPNEGFVSISLSEKVQDDEVELHFQLAHEVCHLLYPTMNLNGESEATSVLNEGVSTYFSILAVEQFGRANEIIENLREYNSNYYEALVLTCQMLKADPKAILKLRAIQPKLNKIERHDFELSDVKIPDDLKSKLLNTFY